MGGVSPHPQMRVDVEAYKRRIAATLGMTCPHCGARDRGAKATAHTLDCSQAEGDES